MSRVQLALNVSDIEEAVEFYSKLFGTQPAKRQPGYANFAIVDPPLKLVLIEDRHAVRAGAEGALNHLGVEVETPDEIRATSRRLNHEGLTTKAEDNTTCCYAVQDKVWVSDPDGAPMGGLHRSRRRTDRDRPEWRRVMLRPSRRRRAPCAARRGPWPFVLLLKDEVCLMRDTVLWRRLLAEVLGSFFLCAVVVGSGIAAQNLSPGGVGLELFENAAATATGLFAIILMFGPISGGHFNPVVSFVDAAFGGLKWRDAAAYLPAQVAGCVWGDRGQRDVLERSHLHLHQAPSQRSALPLRSPRHSWLILVIFALARSGRSTLRPPRSGPTSVPPTSSRARPASPTPPSRSVACSPTASRGSLRLRYRASSTPRCSEAWSPSASSGSSIPGSLLVRQ